MISTGGISRCECSKTAPPLVITPVDNVLQSLLVCAFGIMFSLGIAGIVVVARLWKSQGETTTELRAGLSGVRSDISELRQELHDEKSRRHDLADGLQAQLANVSLAVGEIKGQLSEMSRRHT